MPICPQCGETNPQLAAKCPRDEYYFIHEDAVGQAEHDPRIGTIAADKYVIVGRISKGGMGAVYRAVQLPVEREVAFKVLRTEMEDSDQGRDRFIREARAVSRLGHPNIITLHDFGFEKTGHPYMVMEYAPGRELGDWMRHEQPELERVVHVLRQLLSALEEAHQQQIVHRDLKPENLIVTATASDQDFVKLLDFGIARVVNETSTRGLTREGEVFGTPHYMAPEQAQGAKEVTPAADVYAVGIMLFELLTGEPPFDAGTPLAVLMMHLNEPLPEVVPRDGLMIPPEILEIMHCATDKHPTHRYQNGGEMLAAIDTWMAKSGRMNTGALRSPFHTPPSGLSATDMGAYDTLPDETSSKQLADQIRAERDADDARPPVRLQTGGFGSDVSILDPEPTGNVHRDEITPPSPTDAGGGGRNRLAMVAVVLVVLLVGSVGTIMALTSEEDGPPSDEIATAEETDTATAPDEIAVGTPEVPGANAEDEEIDTNVAGEDPPLEDLTGQTSPDPDEPPVGDPAADDGDDTASDPSPPDQKEADEADEAPKTQNERSGQKKPRRTKKAKTRPAAKKDDPVEETPPDEKTKKEPREKVEVWERLTPEEIKKKKVRGDKW